nr:hypothetical protein GCM10020092_064230 [Actinoplanes digitatis]
MRRPASPSPAGLLTAKLAVPPLPRAFVPRPRLTDRLTEGAEGEATLVSGGPGAGKTLLVAGWAEAGRAPGPVAWLALDACDNDPASFWSYVLGAIRGTGAVPERSPLARMIPGPRLDEAFVRRLAAGIAALTCPVVLVLDDLHEIGNPRILRSLAFLLRHPLGRLRLVITTRADRVPALHRPRIRAGLTELRAAELDFTPEEANRLLAAHDLRLPPTELEALHERTEGWATGLRLAAGFLGVRDPARRAGEFAGTEPAVADYLMSEVLVGEPPEVQQFLRQTSVAERVSGELAEALTGQPRGQQVLERLARANALVTRVAGSAGVVPVPPPAAGPAAVPAAARDTRTRHGPESHGGVLVRRRRRRAGRGRARGRGGGLAARRPPCGDRRRRPDRLGAPPAPRRPAGAGAGEPSSRPPRASHSAARCSHTTAGSTTSCRHRSPGPGRPSPTRTRTCGCRPRSWPARSTRRWPARAAT